MLLTCEMRYVAPIAHRVLIIFKSRCKLQEVGASELHEQDFEWRGENERGSC